MSTMKMLVPVAADVFDTAEKLESIHARALSQARRKASDAKMTEWNDLGVEGWAAVAEQQGIRLGPDAPNMKVIEYLFEGTNPDDAA